MSDTTNDDLILGSLIGVGTTAERWQRALSELELPHLVGAHQTIYAMGADYYRVTAAPIDHPRFMDILRASNVDPAHAFTLETEFSRHWWNDVPEAHYRWALNAIKAVRRDEHFMAGLIQSVKAMTEGVAGVRGYDLGRQLLSEHLADIDRNFTPRNPSGDIRADAALVLAEYDAATQTAGLTEGMVRTGFPEVDSLITGLRPGENLLVAAYSGEGKTTIMQQMVWHAAVVQRKNVLVLTNENARQQYRLRIYNRHSHHLPGGGIEGGLRYNDIKNGSLSGADALVWQRVVNDLGSRPEYGHIEIEQMPTGASMEWVVQTADRYARERKVDLLVLDYIGRMGPIAKRPSRREELNDSITLWKSALVGFDHGAGVPGVTGYQISREKRDQASMTGYYGLNCLAETSEAERNADVVVTSLKLDDVERVIKIQMPKNRDGALLEPTDIIADWATTYIASPLFVPS